MQQTTVQALMEALQQAVQAQAGSGPRVYVNARVHWADSLAAAQELMRKMFVDSEWKVAEKADAGAHWLEVKDPTGKMDFTVFIRDSE